MVYKMIHLNKSPIKLKDLYAHYKDTENKKKNKSVSGSSFNYSSKMIELSLQKLYNLQIIRFNVTQFELWNS